MRAHAMVLMAGVAAKACMNTQGSAVVAGVDLPRGIRRMALVAERLPLVAADLYIPLPFAHRGQRQIGQGDGLHFPPVEERDRWPVQFLGCTRHRFFRRSRQGIAMVVHDVAVQTDDNGPVSKGGVA